MKTPLVVLDTNLFVAAFWNTRSASAWIMMGCLAGDFKLVHTAAIKRELDRILRQIGIGKTYIDQVNSLIEKSVMVEPQPSAIATEDPDDQKFLECAVASNADYIITSDEHLLKLRNVGSTAIVTPMEFRRRIEDQSQ